jgi:hypothetical protein
MRPGKQHVRLTDGHIGAEGAVSRSLLPPFLLRSRGLVTTYPTVGTRSVRVHDGRRT